MINSNYPFAQELITDTQGNIRQVILNFEDYQRLLEGTLSSYENNYQGNTYES